MTRPDPAPQSAPALRLARFEDVVALAGEKRELVLRAALERDVRLVRFEDGQIEFALADGASRTLANDLTRALADWTGRRWIVALSSEPGAPTLREQAESAARERKANATAHPLVQSVLARFPGAQVVDVRDRAPDMPEAEAEAALPEAPPDSDDDDLE